MNAISLAVDCVQAGVVERVKQAVAESREPRPGLEQAAQQAQQAEQAQEEASHAG